MLAGSTNKLKRFLVVGRMLPDTLVPPIHFFNVLVLGKVMTEPCFVTQRHKIGDFGT